MLILLNKKVKQTKGKDKTKNPLAILMMKVCVLLFHCYDILMTILFWYHFFMLLLFDYLKKPQRRIHILPQITPHKLFHVRLFLGIKQSGSTWNIFHLELTSNNSLLRRYTKWQQFDSTWYRLHLEPTSNRK